MTLKGLKAGLSKTTASKNVWLNSHLNAQLPFAGVSFMKQKKTERQETQQQETAVKWEEGTDLTQETEALMQKVRRQPAGNARKTSRPVSPPGPEGPVALRQAVVWSEIIGEPVCRKRKRKAYGNQGNISRR